MKREKKEMKWALDIKLKKKLEKFPVPLYIKIGNIMTYKKKSFQNVKLCSKIHIVLLLMEDVENSNCDTTELSMPLSFND